jgi:hypothetical protein
VGEFELMDETVLVKATFLCAKDGKVYIDLWDVDKGELVVIAVDERSIPVFSEYELKVI